MNDGTASHKMLYRWERRTSALDRPSKPTKTGSLFQIFSIEISKIHLDDIQAWLRQVENASSNAVETVFPRSSSGRQTGKALAHQAAAYAKTSETVHTGKKEKNTSSSFFVSIEIFQRHDKFLTNG